MNNTPYNICIRGLSLLAIILLFAACTEEEVAVELPVFSKITKLYELNSTITSGEMGDWIAIHGNNLETTYSIVFNDIETDMNEVYYEDNILYMQVPIAMPNDINNKVKVITEGGEFNFNFVVNIPQLKLTGMFNEYTAPGDTLKIYGNFFELYEVDPTNTVVSFNGIEKPVINVGNNYITAQVPNNVESNIKLTVINSKYNATVECPGFYQDRQFIITNFDDIPYKGNDGKQYVGEWNDPKPLSGKYTLLDVGPEGSGWSYLMSIACPYTDDMKDNPDKYVVKFELNMILPIINTNFYIYNYWNHPAGQISAADLVVQKLRNWQTINIPLEKIIPLDFNGNRAYVGSFNIRIDSPSGEPIKMAWDNFRITKKD
uniref:glycan-binding surface protein n=1 Tax=uncultured Draconibacterium sp. TaxID=1573823 RepID=UPI0032166F21